jgi:hypothetical protein
MTFSTSPSFGVTLQGGGSSGGGGAASAPLTGTGATITASQPLIDVSQTWNNAAVTFTGAKLNITDTASNAASLLMDLGTGGGSFVSKFKVDKVGSVTLGAGSSASISILAGDTILFQGFGSGFGTQPVRILPAGGIALGPAQEVTLRRRTTANLQLGVADAAAPVAQTLSVQGVVAGTTNTAGANFTITGSQGTGSGAGGSIIFQVAPANGGGGATVQNPLATALTIASTNTATFAGVIVASSGLSSAANILLTTNGGQLFFGASNDLVLARDAANTLALKNGANAQEFRVYETTTGTIYKAILGNRQLMKIAGAAFDNGAGASAGTLANAPAAGNPTKWIPIDDNGTTRYIPAW